MKTLHAVTGMLLGAVVWLAAVLWWAALVSLLEGPTGHWLLPVVYGLTVFAPLALPPAVRFLSALQRERFRALLGVQIIGPRYDALWTAPATWRQLAYHLLAVPLIAGPGGLVVLVCWTAPLLVVLWQGRIGTPWIGAALVLLAAAPWAARGLAAADTALARALLGRGHAEELAALARSRADLVEAADAERRRIERDLHDGVQQRLLSLALNLGMARAAFTGESQAVREVLAAAHDEATATLSELRDFVRGLHPAVLDDRGLDAALSGVAARAPLPVQLRVSVAGRCSPSTEAIAYFAVSEALTNVVRHARATRAEVVAERIGDRLVVTVADDGHGGAATDGTGTGLRGLRQRAAAVDGKLTVVSPAGGPTTVTLDIPCA